MGHSRARGSRAAFICCAGAPEEVEIREAAARVAACASRMLRVVSAFRTPRTGRSISVRIGVHAGEVLAAVMGRTLPRYQLFGSCMDTAQLMEQTSEPGRVHMSPAFCTALRGGGKAELIADERADGTAFLVMLDRVTRSAV